MSTDKIMNSALVQPDAKGVPEGPWTSVGAYVDRPLGLGVAADDVRVRVTCEVKTNGAGCLMRVTEDGTSLGNFDEEVPDTNGQWQVWFGQRDPETDITVGDHKYEVEARCPTPAAATAMDVRNVQLAFIERGT